MAKYPFLSDEWMDAAKAIREEYRGKGELENPEVTLTTDWETSRKIIVEQDQAAAMQAFMSGKIKVAGDMTKLMAMQSSTADPVAEELAKKIAEITE